MSGAIIGWIDFRIEDEAQMAQAVAEARQRATSPRSTTPVLTGPEWAYPNVDTFDCIEVWNGPWPLMTRSRSNSGSRGCGRAALYRRRRQRQSFPQPRSRAHLGVPTLWILLRGANPRRPNCSRRCGQPRHDLRQPTRRASRSAPSGADGRRCNAPRKITPARQRRGQPWKKAARSNCTRRQAVSSVQPIRRTTAVRTGARGRYLRLAPAVGTDNQNAPYRTRSTCAEPASVSGQVPAARY